MGTFTLICSLFIGWRIDHMNEFYNFIFRLRPMQGYCALNALIWRSSCTSVWPKSHKKCLSDEKQIGNFRRNLIIRENELKTKSASSLMFILRTILWKSENQTFCGIWFSIYRSYRVDQKHKSSATKREVAQDSSNAVKVLYKIIIGSSVTFPFTSNSIRSHRASQTHSILEIIQLLLPTACIFFRTMYTPRATAHGPRWGTYLPNAECSALLFGTIYCVWRAFCVFRFFSHRTKNFRMRKTLSAHLSLLAFALCVPANVCIGIISLIRMGAVRARYRPPCPWNERRNAKIHVHPLHIFSANREI